MVTFSLIVSGKKHMSENVLRDRMEQELKKELRALVLRTRAKMNLTQNKMGDRYVVR